MHFQYTDRYGPPRLPYSKDAVAAILHLASRVYLFFPCRESREALQEETVFHLAAPASVSREAETATLSVPRVISAFVLCLMALSLYVYVPSASGQATPLSAVSGTAAATLFTPDITALALPADPSSPPSEGSTPEELRSKALQRSISPSTCRPSPIAPSFTPRPPCPKGSSPARTTASRT